MHLYPQSSWHPPNLSAWGVPLGARWAPELEEKEIENEKMKETIKKLTVYKLVKDATPNRWISSESNDVGVGPGLDDENDVYYVVLIAGDVVENRVLGDESQHRL